MSGHRKKGTRENPISLDDDKPVAKTPTLREGGKSHTKTNLKSTTASSQQGRGEGMSKSSTQKKQKKQSAFLSESSDDDYSSTMRQTRQPWKFGPTDEEFFALEDRPRGSGDYGAHILRTKLRNGTEEAEEETFDISDEGLLYEETDSDGEDQPKKRRKNQKGPAQKRQKPTRKPHISSSKAMDHLMARVTDKSRRDE
ncbi:hypothetical protein F5Y00DRAFT_261878 [Daldinia vernicosa]|uniref:uncharacterized protein n=1 Tax=Daldinia vernicosa TaxID=114800 RepID=UPI002007417C|nr:uncharacterized protein F5Y00DRAFT_261878 [Daldinia vernicosa]KAI0849066.1 hypothetical protein F5Y00DRAFT_261878 [Daldinia vernicosa]